MPDIEKPKADKGEAPMSRQFKAWSLAGQLGYMIAIPIVVFALLGRLADKYAGTSPWLLLLGILLSIFISTYLIYKKTAEVMKDIES